MCMRLSTDAIRSLPWQLAGAAGGDDDAVTGRLRALRRLRPGPADEPARMAGVAYELGEQELSYADILGVQGTLSRHGLHDDPELWGFGRFRRTQRDPAELALASMRRTLALSGAEAGDIDAVVLCSVVFPSGVRAQRELAHRILDGLAVHSVPLMGLTMSRCATLACGLRMADDLLASQRYRTILVASCDAVSDESDRVEPFAIFSDAAASCLLSSTPGEGFELLHTVQASQSTASDSDGPDAGGRLAARANRQLEDAGLAPRSLHKVFHDNLFKPIVSLREQLAGFGPGQLYLDNISAIGHCFGCDPLINLADYCRTSRPQEGALLGLFSSTPGVRTGVVLRTPGRPARH